MRVDLCNKATALAQGDGVTPNGKQKGSGVTTPQPQKIDPKKVAQGDGITPKGKRKGGGVATPQPQKSDSKKVTVSHAGLEPRRRSLARPEGGTRWRSHTKCKKDVARPHYPRGAADKLKTAPASLKSWDKQLAEVGPRWQRALTKMSCQESQSSSKSLVSPNSVPRIC